MDNNINQELFGLHEEAISVTFLISDKRDDKSSGNRLEEAEGRLEKSVDRRTEPCTSKPY